MHATKEQMDKIGRLKKRPDFLRVQKTGRKWVATNMVVQIAPNNEGITRFGITVTKKTFKQAVRRNRIKRRFRTLAYEILPDRLNDNYDIVLIGREGALEANYSALVKDLNWCLKRLEVLK